MRGWIGVALAAAFALSGCGQHKPAPAAHYYLSAATNARFLADNAAKKGVVRLPDGLQYRVIHSGTGRSPEYVGDIVTVAYKGWLINGRVFDQTDPGETASFPAGRLIPGWVEALSIMHAGDEWELVIPSDLGYGAEGGGKAIPPDQTLVFDMTLVSVKSIK